MNKTTKVLGTLTLATLLVTAATSPVHAEEAIASQAVVETLQAAVIAEDATLTFDSAAVTTVPAPVAAPIVEAVPFVAVQPTITPQAATSAETQTLAEDESPEPVAPPTLPEAPSPEPMPEPEAIPAPPINYTPATDIVNWSIESVKGAALAQEGEQYFGSFSSATNIWTEPGFRAVLSDSVYSTPIYHVFQTIVEVEPPVE